MTEQAINKKIIKIEPQAFIAIMVFVFGLGGTYISLHNTQSQIIERLDILAVGQQQMIAKRDADHKEIDQQFAWLTPTLHTVAKKLGLE